MNFSHFFIRRPIFAAVLSIVIVLVGLIAMKQLPIAQYPEIVPPTVVVRAVYPGANPKVLAETVATPIEQEVNGVENMLYMSSTSTSDGVMILTITFKLGTNLNTQGRLLDDQQFGDIIVKQGSQGQVTRVRDVARVELAARDYSVASQLSGKAAAALVIFQLPGSNAIETSDAVRAKLEEMKRTFPPGVDYRVIYDTTLFARESIQAVVHTLFEAVLLVVLVVLVFLQTWRASIIPMLAVPVSLICTFAVMKLVGFSLNNLSLFGLVLAIGIVVDDAIVVVENVERNIALGLTPVEATKKAMNEVSGPVIAVAL